MQELRVGCELLKPLGAYLPEQTYWIPADFVPQRRANQLEYIPGFGMPTPAKIAREIVESRQALG